MSKTYPDGVKPLSDKARCGRNINIKRILFYEMYKTGEDPYIYSPYRIVGKLMDGEYILDKFDIMWNPGESCLVSSDWIKGSPTFTGELDKMQSSKAAFKQFMTTFGALSDYRIPNRRIVLCGFGNHGDDDILLRRWFTENTEPWEFGKIFYPMTMDIMGASSVAMIDVVDGVGELDLGWAVVASSFKIDAHKMNDPDYRIDAMIKIYKTRFCKAMHIHTITMMERKLLKQRARLTNLKKYNI